jgi:hemolysin III
MEKLPKQNPTPRAATAPRTDAETPPVPTVTPAPPTTPDEAKEHKSLVVPRIVYSHGEEIFNFTTHAVGGVFGIVAMVICIIITSVHYDGFALASSIIYGGSIVLAYLSSSLYHAFRQGRTKRIFQVFDHCSIFVLIAGTYTPFLLVSLREQGAWGWSLFFSLWGLAIVGLTLKAIFLRNKIVQKISMGVYMLMGWCAVIAIVPILRVVDMTGIVLTALGGVSYTIGAVFYAFSRRKRYIHSVWHLFVLLGTALQFWAILGYVFL